jgi:hypothetical protein
MRIPGSADNTGTHSSAFAVQLDPTSFITKCATAEEARSLLAGSVVADRHGGLTFSDEVAAVLEARSYGGWREIEFTGERWTIIFINN